MTVHSQAAIERIMAEPNPLELWLDGKPGLKAWKFADNHKIPRTSIYALIRGENLNPSTELMRKVERATGGDVTVQSLADWAGKKHDRQSRS